ncbi:hypothetical protein G7B40_034025 [Aetokthonos hydrillicola Thurmond2011]|jgi:hypothetical protein|uniref:vWA-MoxR associated protein C-terminal domain-containing protein n=1 Tax=Aetokthonos hydrillicola Thurmond2011 TaxID=2712845 RepID=A0AAP5MBR9_9CYAN|nr:hypothetical protein [Aetokthonos hydrillicola]MBO3459771.1 hypothetical protein [Aetokthonos hydrillicola CCALA 1050]MBW4585204.1 hypothetical protein [Aetokthonos hydrillicola CCALA 1050]MDR9899540.1 hypothetical protein [Aetokthonos hydrillicola Thurmond2011]
MSESCCDPKDTYAVIVGIEKYEKVGVGDLPGAASNALEFAKWLCEQEVPKENIFLFISELEENKDLVKTYQFNVEKASRDKIYHAIFNDINQKQGCILYIFWAGHGYISDVDNRRLLYADGQQNLNLPSLRRSLKTDTFSGFNKQILIIDACAVYAKSTSRLQYFGEQLPKEEYPIGKPKSNCEQVVLLATKAGETAKFNNNSGLFSGVLLKELRNKKRLLLPKEMREIVEEVKKVFNQGEYKDEQTPISLYYRDRDKDGNEDGNEEILGLTKTAKIYNLLDDRWDKLLSILYEVNESYVLYISCYFALSQFKQDVIGNYPRIVLLKSEENKNERENIFNYLKTIFLGNIINKNKKSNPISSLYLFVDYLFRLSTEKTIKKKLQEWKKETNHELPRLDINPQSRGRSRKLQTIYRDFNPYLVITCEPKSSEKLYLSAELIFQKNKDIKIFPIIDKKEIETTHVQQKFDSLLLLSYKIIGLCEYKNGNDTLIVEIFVTCEQLKKTSQECFEKIEIKIDNFSGDRKWISCHHKFVLRSFERLSNFDYTPISILQKKWDELNDLVSSEQEISNKIEWICSESLNSESKRDILGINLLYFSKDKLNKSINQVIQEGLPLFIWVREICSREETVREEFENLLRVNNLDGLLENIKNKRLDAYRNQQQTHLGYHIGLLCDNPYRLPSYYREDDNAVTFGT